jgi:hypothetical protein
MLLEVEVVDGGLEEGAVSKVAVFPLEREIDIVTGGVQMSRESPRGPQSAANNDGASLPDEAMPAHVKTMTEMRGASRMSPGLFEGKGWIESGRTTRQRPASFVPGRN